MYICLIFINIHHRIFLFYSLLFNFCLNIDITTYERFPKLSEYQSILLMLENAEIIFAKKDRCKLSLSILIVIPNYNILLQKKSIKVFSKKCFLNIQTDCILSVFDFVLHNI